MNKIEEFEKKIQQLKEKCQRANETSSRLRKENILLKKDIQEKNILLSNSPAGIVLIWRGRILEVNDTFLGYMGYKAEEMINRNFLNFVHPDHLSEVRFIHNKWSAGKIDRGHYDTRLVTEKDEAILCSIESKRVRYRGRASYILNITRLEEREDNENKIRQEIRSNIELQMIEGFKTLLKKRSGPIHDLLKTLRETGVSQKKGLEHAVEKLKNEQEDILKETMMLEVIVSEKEDSQDKKVIEIKQIINDAIAGAESILKDQEIQIETFLRTSSSVYGNLQELKDSLTQLILQTISNVSGNGDIHITAEENAEKINIYLQDTGVPLEEDKIKNIFEPFAVQGRPPVHALGMRFVKAVIERHNGEIEFLPGRGLGNIFQVSLPVYRERKKRKKTDRNKLKKARVLIIQSDDIAKELLAHLLIEKGCGVERTGSSAEGLVAIKKKKINMLIVDIETLGMNFTAFRKKCRQINPGLITVCISDRSHYRSGRHTRDTDPDLQILKPFDVKETVKKISELFMVKY